MDRLNYHHLLYFWTVVREGGLVPAGKALRLSHPTLSTQIRALEEQIGEKLLVKVGRRLEPTEMGQVVVRYADEIFALGRELVNTVHGGPSARIARLHIGVVDVVPKLIVRRMLQAALAMTDPVRLVCREDSHDRLLADLALHSLDIVISDAPVTSGGGVRAFTHLLGETSVTFFGARSIARAYRKGFPRTLHGAPLLLPLEGSTLRRSLNLWFDRQRIVPRVVAEFEDSALLKVFGSEGVGLFAAPSVVASEVQEQYGVEPIGEAPEVRERFYAISAERRIKHPAVVAITESARQDLFAPG